MAPNGKASRVRLAQVFDRLPLGGKKTVMAGVLVLIMLFMWVRVLVGHRPAAAAASPRPPAATVVPRPPARVQRHELPRIPGRHDTLARDFFTMKDPACFGRNPARHSAGTETEVPVGSTENAAEVIQRVARTMKLEAVSWSESPQIFINDRLLSVGDRFLVKGDTQSYEFEVWQIYVDSVRVRCQGVQLTLRLAQPLEVVN